MSVIDYYNISDAYSASLGAQFNKKRQEIQQQYLDQERVINAANIVNAISGMDINTIESEIINQIDLSGLDIGELSGEVAGAEQALYSAISKQDSKAFSSALEDLIKLKNNLINGEKWHLSQSDAFELQGLTLEKIQQEGNIANQIGRAGEILAQFQMNQVAESLINELVLKGQGQIGDFHVLMEDTGRVRAHSASGLGTKNVNIQTDSRLTVSNEQVKYVINFSEKSSGRFATNVKSKLSAKLRESSVGSFVNTFGMKYEIINALSLHRQESSKHYVLLSEARNQARLAMGAYLFASLVEEEKISEKGDLLNDAINFTIVGARLIPEENILKRLYDKFNNDNLKASVEGVSYNTILKQRDASLWRTTDDAEPYFMGRAIKLTMSI